MQRGRPPLPRGLGQEERLTVRVQPSLKAAFASTAQRRGLSVAAAHRAAMRAWISKNKET
jgi:predicted HicB family RNase H-like nuclease